MDQAFVTAFEERLGELTGELAYFHKASGQDRGFRIYEGQLPAMAVGGAKDDLCPLICWSDAKGEITRMKPNSFEVKVDVGLVVDERSGSQEDHIKKGYRQIREVNEALAGLAEQPFIEGYKLQLPYRYVKGDPAHPGPQPVPYFWLQLQLSFLAR